MPRLYLALFALVASTSACKTEFTGTNEGGQKNLGTSLQLIIDTIVGASSPAVLEYIPISASLAVAVDQTQLQRSRVQGFDYVSSSNSLVFIGVPFPKGSQVIASYRRWVKQGILE